MTGTPDPNAYPTREEDATADRLCRHLTRTANRRQEHIKDLAARVSTTPGSPANREFSDQNSTLVREFAVVYLFRGIDEFFETADDLAREIWNAWEDGATVSELLYEWAAEYGQLAEGAGAATLNGMPPDDEGKATTSSESDEPPPAAMEALETDLIRYVRECAARVVSREGLGEDDERWRIAYEVVDVAHTHLREVLLKHLPPPPRGPEPEETPSAGAGPART